MRYKLIIFDMDGTTLNTLVDLTNSLNFVLNKYGFPQRTLSEVRGFVGNGIHKLVERGVPKGASNEMIEKVYNAFSVHYKEHCCDNTMPYDGIVDLLQILKEKGYSIATVSNKADYAVNSLCKQYFDGLFDISIGEAPGIRKKPYPDSVQRVLQELKVDKMRAVYIGDSEVDIETAKNAEMDCISVDWGFRDSDFLKQAGATKIVSTSNELLNEIEA